MKAIYHVSFCTDTSSPIIGYVEAIDLRDAASRFLTSDMGMSLALSNKVSADVLHQFPCNFDTEIRVAEEHWSISISRVSENKLSVG